MLPPIGKVRYIQARVAERLGVPVADITARTRRRDATVARQIAMLIARRLTLHSFNAIGRVFQRDHSTVIHDVHAARQRIADDQKLAAIVQELERELLT